MMKLKLAILIAYLLVIIAPAAFVAQSVPAQDDATKPACDKAGKCGDPANHVITLDLKGVQGKVCFAHKTHEKYINPDPDFAHTTQQGAECIGCHHRRNEVSDAPTLWKCDSCHRDESTQTNPRNHEGDEMYNKRVFHELCIGCHTASNTKADSKCKAPVACTDCHEPGTGVPRAVSGQ
jgi:Class III cytochrome C family